MRLAGSAMDILRGVEGRHLKAKLVPFSPGDTIRVTLRVPEAGKERLQMYEGVVTSRRGRGAAESFTVRKISFGVGVERTFPVHSPFVTTIEVVKMGRTRRSKLYFLREKSGKAARLKQEFAGAVADSTGPVAADGGAAPEAAPEEAPAKPAAEAKPAPKAEKKAEARPAAEAKPAKKEKKAEPKK